MFLQAKSAAAVAVFMVMMAEAQAVLPAGVTAAVTEAGVDGGILVGALAAAGAVVFLIHKVLTRFGISI